MAPLYRPPTAVTTGEFPYEALVTQADPAWARGKYWEPYYIFSGHVFFNNPYTSGPYSRLSNVYPVGAQYGQPDPLIIDNLEPSYAGNYVANPIPGLYEGVPDDNGWA